MDNERKDRLEAEADGLIEGRNAVIEALRAGGTIDKIYLAKGDTDKTLGHIASTARAAGVVVVEADRRKLDAMSRTHAHQGHCFLQIRFTPRSVTITRPVISTVPKQRMLWLPMAV